MKRKNIEKPGIAIYRQNEKPVFRFGRLGSVSKMISRDKRAKNYALGTGRTFSRWIGFTDDEFKSIATSLGGVPELLEFALKEAKRVGLISSVPKFNKKVEAELLAGSVEVKEEVVETPEVKEEVVEPEPKIEDIKEPEPVKEEPKIEVKTEVKEEVVIETNNTEVPF